MSITSAQAWEALSEQLQLPTRLAQDRLVEVEAGAIKQLTGWEPRLLMKMDSRSQRPPALARLQATILPVRNGRYA
ncbi:hypothetical protein IV102_07450, partial [bacterium]|nr:hypothetical protein [bacterium]